MQSCSIHAGAVANPCDFSIQLDSQYSVEAKVGTQQTIAKFKLSNGHTSSQEFAITRHTMLQFGLNIPPSGYTVIVPAQSDEIITLETAQAVSLGSLQAYPISYGINVRAHINGCRSKEAGVLVYMSYIDFKEFPSE